MGVGGRHYGRRRSEGGGFLGGRVERGEASVGEALLTETEPKTPVEIGWRKCTLTGSQALQLQTPTMESCEPKLHAGRKIVMMVSAETDSRRDSEKGP